VKNEITKRTPAGICLEERRARVLAALGMTQEEALAKLTFEPRGDRG
jgi:hypothetical protein